MVQDDWKNTWRGLKDGALVIGFQRETKLVESCGGFLPY